jgi:AcrR family transcriptional regulator
VTRQQILGAARRLFAERGYAGTTVRDVAAAAGVSPQTVYDSVGAKRDLVARLNDLIDAEAGVGELVATGLAAADPADVVATSARVTRAIVERCGDIVHALLTGAAAEPELAAVLDEGQRRHLAGAERVVAVLGERGELAGEADEAAASLAALTDLRFALLLRDTYGWTPARIETWTATTATARIVR